MRHHAPLVVLIADQATLTVRTQGRDAFGAFDVHTCVGLHVKTPNQLKLEW